MCVCSSLIQARIRKRKVMEDGGIHPLLPIHKHDLWVILHWESWEGLRWCHKDVVGSAAGRVCVSLSVSEGLTRAKDLKVSQLCLLFMHKVRVCSQGLIFFLLFSFVKSRQIRAALRFGC